MFQKFPQKIKNVLPKISQPWAWLAAICCQTNSSITDTKTAKICHHQITNSTLPSSRNVIIHQQDRLKFARSTIQHAHVLPIKLFYSQLSQCNATLTLTLIHMTYSNEHRPSTSVAPILTVRNVHSNFAFYIFSFSSEGPVWDKQTKRQMDKVYQRGCITKYKHERNHSLTWCILSCSEDCVINYTKTVYNAFSEFLS